MDSMGLMCKDLDHYTYFSSRYQTKIDYFLLVLLMNTGYNVLWRLSSADHPGHATVSQVFVFPTPYSILCFMETLAARN